jgi:hypothetical protein
VGEHVDDISNMIKTTKIELEAHSQRLEVAIGAWRLPQATE